MSENKEEVIVSSVSMPKSLYDLVDIAIEKERKETGIKLARSQFVCRAVNEWVKKSGSDA